MGLCPLPLLRLVGALHSASQYTDGPENFCSAFATGTKSGRPARRYGRPRVQGDSDRQQLDSLWQEVQRRLEASVPDSTFNLWLRPLKVLGARGTTLHLSAPDSIRSWVERRYAALIGEALEAAGAALSEISFAPARGPRRGGRRRPQPQLHLRALRDRRGQSLRPRRRAGRGRGALRGLQPALPPRPARARQDPPPGRDRQLPAAPTRPVSASATRPPSPSPTSSSTRCGRRAAKPSSTATATSTSCSSTTSSSSRANSTPKKSSSTPSTLSTRAAARSSSPSDRTPSQLSTLAERLRDRFEWGLTVAVEPPNLATRVTVLRRLVREAGLPDGEGDGDALAELAGRINANVRQLHGALTRVIAHASLTARPLDSKLIAELIPHPSPQRQETPVEEIQQHVATAFGISRAELVGSSRAAVPLRARQVAILLTRESTGLSLPQIGRLYGGRDHSTVLNSLRRIEVGMAEDPDAGRESRQAALRDPQARRRSAADGRRHCKNQCLPTAQSTTVISRPNAVIPAILGVSTSAKPTRESNHQLKLSTKREELVSKLSVVSRAVSTRAATQSLSGILIVVDEAGAVSLSATDLEMGLQTELEARGGGPRLGPPPRPPARRARPLARRRHGSARGARGRARRRDPQRRLELPPAGAPRRGLPQVPGRGRGAAEDPGRGDGRDGRRRRPRRLARRHAPGPDRGPGQRRRRRDDDGRHRLLPARGQDDRSSSPAIGGELEANIPARALRELGRIVTADGVEQVAVSLLPNQAVFRAGAIVLNTRLIDGQFPNFRQLLPESYEHDVRLPRAGIPRGHPPRQPARPAQRAAAALLLLGRADDRRLDARRRRRRRDDAGGLRGGGAGDRLQPRVPQGGDRERRGRRGDAAA